MHSVSDTDRGLHLTPGAEHYRAFVGPPERYDLVAALQFNLLTCLGLREDHQLLDIGCGSCRAGRLFIPYLLPGRYYGIEPQRWLIDEGIERELGREILKVKRPTFDHDDQFTLTRFGCTFDFLLAQSIFSHTAPAQLGRCLDQARQVMNPEAIFVANYKAGTTNYGGHDWLYPQCATYTPAFMADMIGQAGLRCVPIEWPHPGLTWMVIVHPERTQPLPALPVFRRQERKPPTGAMGRLMRRLGF